IQPRELAADRPLRVDAAEHQIGIGDSRPVSAEPVTDRSRISAGGFRPDLQHAAAIHPGDRPPPAPMVVISIIGVRTTRPKSIAVCAASALSPPTTSDTSKLVPPMSQVMTLG